MKTFELCSRCNGTGSCTHEVAPWVRPVAQVAGLALAEVTVPCDRCSGTGMAHLGDTALASWVRQ